MADFPPKVDTALKPKPETGWAGGVLKGTREKVLAMIAASALSEAQKAVLVEEVNSVDVKHDLVQVHFHRHKHGAGGNGTYTVMEL